VFFSDVIRIEIPTLIDDLEIELAENDALPPGSESLGAHELFDRKVYLVKGRNCLGYVVAGWVACHEDDGEYSSPSSLYEPFGL
jgi:hypothetical protein